MPGARCRKLSPAERVAVHTRALDDNAGAGWRSLHDRPTRRLVDDRMDDFDIAQAFAESAEDFVR